MAQRPLVLTIFPASLISVPEEDIPPLADGAWTIAVIPDTQYYS